MYISTDAFMFLFAKQIDARVAFLIVSTMKQTILVNFIFPSYSASYLKHRSFFLSFDINLYVCFFSFSFHLFFLP